MGGRPPTENLGGGGPTPDTIRDGQDHPQQAMGVAATTADKHGGGRSHPRRWLGVATTPPKGSMMHIGGV